MARLGFIPTKTHKKPAKTISIAQYLAEKYGYAIDLLPYPDNEKSADSFNHTLGSEQEYKVNSKPAKGAIDNALRKAARQATHIVLIIDSSIDLPILTRGIRGCVSQSQIEEVVVILNSKDLTLTREIIMSKDFNMQQRTSNNEVLLKGGSRPCGLEPLQRY